MNDESKAFDIENGLQVNDDGPFFTGGPSSPIGLDLSPNTMYVQNDGSKIVLWQKFGAGNGDWRIYPASDVGFDPTGTSSLSDNVQDALIEAITAIENNVYGRDFHQETKVASETTSGSSFTTYDVLNFNVSDSSGTNSYRLNADFLWGHNSTSNDIRVRVLLDGSPVKEIRIEPKDAGGDQRFQNNIIYYAENLSQGSHSFALQYRPAVSSRTSRMYESVIESWRVE